MTMTTELVELADRLEALAGALGNIDPDGGSAGYRLLGDAYGEAEEIAAAIRALASRAGGWRPIAEAPVSSDPMLGDVEDCLVYGPEIGRKMGRAWKYADGKVRAQAYGFHGDWKITHFQPLPEPPAAPEPVAEGSNNSTNDEEEAP